MSPPTSKTSSALRGTTSPSTTTSYPRNARRCGAAPSNSRATTTTSTWRLSSSVFVLPGTGLRSSPPKVPGQGDPCPHCTKLNDARANLLVGKEIRQRFIDQETRDYVWHRGRVVSYLGFPPVNNTQQDALAREGNFFLVKYDDQMEARLELGTVLRVVTN